MWSAGTYCRATRTPKAADVRQTTHVVYIDKNKGAATRAAPHFYSLGTRIRFSGLHVYRGNESEAGARGKIFGYVETQYEATRPFGPVLLAVFQAHSLPFSAPK